MSDRGLRQYVNNARRLADVCSIPFPLVLGRMVAARLLHQRGPAEFERFRFAGKPVRRWRAYLSERELVAMQERVAPRDARGFEEDKLRFARHCVEQDLPTIRPLAVLSSEPMGDPLWLSSADALGGFFRTRRDIEGFAKPLTGGQGYGTFQFTVRDGVLEPREQFASVEELDTLCTRGRFAGGGYLLQERIHPHPELLPFMPGPGLGTLRIKTFLMRDGSIHVPQVFLRIPARGAESDNSRTHSLIVLVDQATGELQAALSRAANGGADLVADTVARHPETGVRFFGATLPCWPEVMAVVKRAARAFPMLPALGWDVAIAPQGPVIVEANWRFGVYLEEAYTNRGWRRDYVELYRDVAAPVLPAAEPFAGSGYAHGADSPTGKPK